MPVAGSDLLWKLSVKTGSAGNSVVGSPAASLGRFVSTTLWDQNTLQNNLFDDVTGDDNLASLVDYRCVFIHNSHASLPLNLPVIHLDSQADGGATITIGLDPTPNSAIGSSSDQAVSIANETTAPAGVTFTETAVSRATGLSFPDLLPGHCRAVWIARAASNSAALNEDKFVLAITGDTLA